MYGESREAPRGMGLRILFVLVSVLSAAFPGIVVYVVLWILMPERES